MTDPTTPLPPTPPPPAPLPGADPLDGHADSPRAIDALVVPHQPRVKAVMSEIRIDLRYAVLPHSCRIDVSAIMGNVQVIVPPGMVVDFDVGSFMAATRNDARAQRLDGGW